MEGSFVFFGGMVVGCSRNATSQEKIIKGEILFLYFNYHIIFLRFFLTHGTTHLFFY